ncbi:hypothetical protein F4779DRAFT_418914 [Xylariaceae sp. FL0662B]|nr:hypothetical protein F4779DRAFT_418914 [Xylariaceae sp. FL0662B]
MDDPSIDLSHCFELDTVGNVPETPGKLLSQNYEYDNKYAPLNGPEDLPKSHGRDRPCLFRENVVDECYRSRFYARALELCLLERDVEPFQPYDCLMLNCPQRGFENVKDMLRHLKDCDFFSQGKFYCPTCHETETFRTASKKRCAWDRMGFTQRVRQTFRTPIDTFRSLVGPHGGPRSNPAPATTLPKSAIDRHPQEMPDTSRQVELIGDTSLLPASAGVQHNNITCGELYGSSGFSMNPSPIFNSPLELSSASISQAGMTLPDISPSSSIKSSKHVSHSRNRQQYVSTSGYRRVDGASSSYDSRFQFNHNDNACEADLNPHHTQPAILYPVSPGFNFQPANTAVFSLGQPSGRTERGPSLTINTSSLQIDMDTSAWIDEATGRDNDTLDTPDSAELPIQSNSTPTELRFTTPSPLDSEITADFTTGQPSPRTEDIKSTNDSSPPTSVPSSSSSDKPPGLGLLGDDLRCPLCNFSPTGKKENRRSYYQKHIKKHSDLRFNCTHPGCGKSFTRQDNLSNHIRKRHKSPNESAAKRRRGSSDSLELVGAPRKKSFSFI